MFWARHLPPEKSVGFTFEVVLDQRGHTRLLPLIPSRMGLYQLCKFTERHWSMLSDGKLARQTKKLANNCTCTFICHMCPCELKNKVFPAYGGLCLSGTDFHMETVLNWNFGVWMLFCKFKSSPFLPFCIHARFTKAVLSFALHTHTDLLGTKLGRAATYDYFHSKSTWWSFSTINWWVASLNIKKMNQNFPEAKVTSSDCFFCPTSIPNPTASSLTTSILYKHGKSFILETQLYITLVVCETCHHYRQLTQCCSHKLRSRPVLLGLGGILKFEELMEIIKSEMYSLWLK